MRAIEVPVHLLQQIGAHARVAYPEECCGFLIARPEDSGRPGVRTLVRSIQGANEFDGERRRRFLLRPEELRAVESGLDPVRERLAGFYHSHPDHPPRPSQFDQDHAWPWYAYLVVGIDARSLGQMRGFELEPETAEFREVPLRKGVATPRTAPLATVVGRD